MPATVAGVRCLAQSLARAASAGRLRPTRAIAANVLASVGYLWVLAVATLLLIALLRRFPLGFRELSAVQPDGDALRKDRP